jgi:hypothetical protein
MCICTYAGTHTLKTLSKNLCICTYTATHTHTLSLSLSYTHTHTHTLSLSLSLSHLDDKLEAFKEIAFETCENKHEVRVVIQLIQELWVHVDRLEPFIIQNLV